MKKLLVVLVLCLVALGCVFAQAEAEKAKGPTHTIGISISSYTTNSVFVDIRKLINEEAKKNNWKIIENNLTADTITATIENFISAGCDIIVCQVNQADAAFKALLPQIEAAGITVMSYDYDGIKNEPCVAYSITCANYESGYFMGKYAAEWANENIKGHVYAGVLQRESNETFRYRGYGIIDALNEYLKDGEVCVSLETKPGSVEGGLKAAEDALAACPKMNLCCVWNGGGGVGAYEALKQRGWDGALFTIDCSSEEIDALLNKDILKGSLYLETAKMVLEGLYDTIAYVENGKKYPAGKEDNVRYFPMVMVTPEEAAKYRVV